MKKKLIFFIGGLNFGGMERVVFIAKELLANDYDIKIVTLYQNNADYIKDDNYYNIDVPPSKHKIITFIKRFFRTIKMKKKLKPDMVFSFGMYLNYLNILTNIFIKHKPTTIVGIRSYDWLTEPFVTTKTDKWIMKHADRINSVSKQIAIDAEKIWDIPLNKNQVIYNPYDIDYIADKATEKIDDFTFERDKFYIITMGRLVNQKGFNHLIRAFDSLSKHHDNARLLILGNGDKKDNLEQMIHDYKLDNKILLLGGKKNPYKYVKKSNLYVLSSLTEGFPNALSEAMCIGTPIVSVNCKSGPSEIITAKDLDFNNKNFLVCEYGILSPELKADKNYEKKEISKTEHCLSEALSYAIDNEEEMKKIAQKAKDHMKEFSYDRFYDRLKDILK